MEFSHWQVPANVNENENKPLPPPNATPQTASVSVQVKKVPLPPNATGGRGPVKKWMQRCGIHAMSTEELYDAVKFENARLKEMELAEKRKARNQKKKMKDAEHDWLTEGNSGNLPQPTDFFGDDACEVRNPVMVPSSGMGGVTTKPKPGNQQPYCESAIDSDDEDNYDTSKTRTGPRGVIREMYPILEPNVGMTTAQDDSNPISFGFSAPPGPYFRDLEDEFGSDPPGPYTRELRKEFLENPGLRVDDSFSADQYFENLISPTAQSTLRPRSFPVNVTEAWSQTLQQGSTTPLRSPGTPSNYRDGHRSMMTRVEDPKTADQECLLAHNNYYGDGTFSPALYTPVTLEDNRIAYFPSVAYGGHGNHRVSDADQAATNQPPRVSGVQHGPSAVGFTGIGHSGGLRPPTVDELKSYYYPGGSHAHMRSQREKEAPKKLR